MITKKELEIELRTLKDEQERLRYISSEYCAQMYENGGHSYYDHGKYNGMLEIDSILNSDFYNPISFECFKNRHGIRTKPKSDIILIIDAFETVAKIGLICILFMMYIMMFGAFPIIMVGLHLVLLLATLFYNNF